MKIADQSFRLEKAIREARLLREERLRMHAEMLEFLQHYGFAIREAKEALVSAEDLRKSKTDA